MKQTVTKNQFIRAFTDMNRANHFSRKGLECLFEYLEDMESQTDTEIEFDVIAICCDFSEGLIEDVLKEYNVDSLDELKNETTVIEVDDDTIIYQNF